MSVLVSETNALSAWYAIPIANPPYFAVGTAKFLQLQQLSESSATSVRAYIRDNNKVRYFFDVSQKHLPRIYAEIASSSKI